MSYQCEQSSADATRDLRGEYNDCLASGGIAKYSECRQVLRRAMKGKHFNHKTLEIEGISGYS